MEDERDGSSRPPHVWSPPDAGASPDAAVGRAGRTTGGDPQAEAPDGPPPPPWERAERRRRRWALGVAAVVVLGVPIGLAVAGGLGTPGTSDAPEDDAAAPGDEGQDLEAPDDLDDLEPAPRPLDTPDLDRLEGPDAIFAELLLDIDASEMAMLGFQNDVAAAFRDHGAGNAAELLRALSDAGAAGADALAATRGALEEQVGDVRAETVREVYLEHLDSWVRYMRAVEEEPALFGPDGDTSRYTLSINATADAFARSLEGQLPDDLDPEVGLMAEQLLDRGFRSSAEADV